MLQEQRKQILRGTEWRHVLMKVGPPLEDAKDSEKTDHVENDGEDKTKK